MDKLQYLMENFAFSKLKEMAENKYPEAKEIKGYFHYRVEFKAKGMKVFAYLGYGSDYWEDGFVLNCVGNGFGKIMANAKKGIFNISRM